MVSHQRRSKEGIFLIRKTVKEGNETRNLVSAGAGAVLLQSNVPDDDPIKLVRYRDSEPLLPTSAAVIAVKRHIQKVSSPHGKNVSLSDKLNRRLSGSFLVQPKVENPPPVLPEEQFLAGTPIFYKALLSLQAKSGNYLTFNDSNINASSDNALPATQFVIMNADNTGDDGNMRYGNAVWLVVDNRRVLGSQYSGIGTNRKLRPALIKCSKAHLFRAHHIGRWIIMSKDDPIGKIGKSCLHGDRIMLEQEWLFLSSSSPTEVSLYKTKNTINNATGKNIHNIDYFEAIEDCTWRVRLIAQKDMGTTDGRKRAHLITRANTQLVTSLKGRWKIKDDLFGQLADKVDKKIESDKVSRSLKHKLTNKLDQEHLMRLYHDHSSVDFKSPKWFFATPKDSDSDENSPRKIPIKDSIIEKNDLKNDKNDGNSPNNSPKNIKNNNPNPNSPLKINFDSSIEMNDFDNINIHSGYTPRSRTRRKSAFPSHNLNYNRLAFTLKLERMNNNYWRIAQKLLVKTDAWYVVNEAMIKYYNCPGIREKIKSAIIIQRFVRKYCKFLKMTLRSMILVDKDTTEQLFMKSEWKNDFKQQLKLKKEMELVEQKIIYEIPYNADVEPVEEKNLNSTFSFQLMSNTMSHDMKNSYDADKNERVVVHDTVSNIGITSSYRSPGPGGEPSALSEFMAKNFKSTLMLPNKPGISTLKSYTMRVGSSFIDTGKKNDNNLPLRKCSSFNPSSKNARELNNWMISNNIPGSRSEDSIIPLEKNLPKIDEKNDEKVDEKSARKNSEKSDQKSVDKVQKIDQKTSGKSDKIISEKIDEIVSIPNKVTVSSTLPLYLPRPSTSLGIRSTAKVNVGRTEDMTFEYNVDNNVTENDIDTGRNSRLKIDKIDKIGVDYIAPIRPKTASSRLQHSSSDSAEPNNYREKTVSEMMISGNYREKSVEQAYLITMQKRMEEEKVKEKEEQEKELEEREEEEKLLKQARSRLRKQARQIRKDEKKEFKLQTIAKFGISAENPSGLPSDVFENFQSKVSAKTGFNFLRSASLKRGIKFGKTM